MATTSPDNIWTPDSGDDYALTVDLAAMADTVQDAISANRGYRVGSNSDRLSLTGGQLFEGLHFWATDTKIEWVYSGGSWVAQDTGWVSISTFTNGFSAASPAPAYRILNNEVHLSGQLFRSTAPTTFLTAASIPTGPRGNASASTVASWDLEVQITSGGSIQIQASVPRTSGAGYGLDGISFPVA